MVQLRVCHVVCMGGVTSLCSSVIALVCVPSRHIRTDRPGSVGSVWAEYEGKKAVCKCWKKWENVSKLSRFLGVCP